MNSKDFNISLTNQLKAYTINGFNAFMNNLSTKKQHNINHLYQYMDNAIKTNNNRTPAVFTKQKNSIYKTNN